MTYDGGNLLRTGRTVCESDTFSSTPPSLYQFDSSSERSAYNCLVVELIATMLAALED